MTKTKVFAVYLAYNPDIQLLEKSVKSILRAVDKVIIYDNNSTDFIEITSDNVDIIRGQENIGVSGLNKAIDYAFSDGADAIIVLDQDSNLSGRYVSSASEKSSESLCVVAPAYIDRERELLSKTTRVGKFLVTRESHLMNESYVETDFAIGSGLFIRKEIWQKVGAFSESLFLDCVDIDYCFRLKKNNVAIFMDFKNIMNHSIGDDYLSVFGFKVSNHKPFRHYLYFRNSFALIRANYTPYSWKIMQLMKVFSQGVIYSLFSKSKFENFKAFIKALIDQKNIHLD